MTVSPDPVQYLRRDGYPALAYRFIDGPGAVVVFLPGYMSDMGGSKASALFDWARREGHACLLLDYSGCGASEGDFRDGTLSRWRDEVLALADHVAPGRTLLPVGSSMGGWLMLLVAAARPEQVRAMVGIAAAPDFTRWGFDAAKRARLAAGETVEAPNPYDPDRPEITSAAFFADAEAQLMLGAPIPFDGPVRLLHGRADAEVPFAIAGQLAGRLCSAEVQVIAIEAGDHRLSRPQDIDRLLATVDALLAYLG